MNPSAASDLTFEVIPTKPGVGSFFFVPDRVGEKGIGWEKTWFDKEKLSIENTCLI